MKNVSQAIKEKLLSAITQVEDGLFNAKYKLKEELHLLEPIIIIPYNGFGNDNYVYIKGRVLEDEKIKEKQGKASVRTHLRNMYKRFESDEIPGIKVRASFAGMVLEQETDDEGYFTFEFRTKEPIDYVKAGQKVKFQLLEQKTEGDKIEAEAHIFVPNQDAEFGIISDIDDTVLVSNISNFLYRLKLILMKDAVERSPFPGVSGFLRALCKGSDNRGNNPLFYISGSEWNLYDLLLTFLSSHDIPEGPLLLRDKGTQSRQGKQQTGTVEYKCEQIQHILETYPNLKFICIGDSGEHDPEIYQKMAAEFPERILCVYIRDVSPAKRDKEVKKIAEQLKEHNVEMELMEETLSAAKHALKMGWINEAQLEDVRKECEEDEHHRK